MDGEREEIAKEVAERYNNREGNITDLVVEYEGYSRHKFYRDIEKLGITKDKEIDKYIIPDANIKGQINLLEQVGSEEKEILEPIGDILEEKEIKEMQQDIKNKDAIVTEPPYKKKKKTFEIDVELEQLIRIQAAIEDITINEWVNQILWAAIPEDTRRIVKN